MCKDWCLIWVLVLERAKHKSLVCPICCEQRKGEKFFFRVFDSYEISRFFSDDSNFFYLLIIKGELTDVQTPTICQ